MRAISQKNKNVINTDPFYQSCIRQKEGTCQGCITMEHALIYGGRQMDEIFAILPVCEYHHAVNQFQDSGDLNKKLHEYIAISRMTEEDKKKYPKRDWDKELKLYESNF